jgi:hypothetical protein
MCVVEGERRKEIKCVNAAHAERRKEMLIVKRERKR